MVQCHPSSRALLLLITVVVDHLGSDPALTGIVTDAYTGEPVEGIQVAAGATAVQTDGSGSFSFDDTAERGALDIRRELREYPDSRCTERRATGHHHPPDDAYWHRH